MFYYVPSGQTLISQISLIMFHGQVMVMQWTTFKILLNDIVRFSSEQQKFHFIYQGILHCLRSIPYTIKLNDI